MAGKENEAVQKAAPRAVSSPTYTVQEFAAAPHILGAKSPDIVRAALLKAGKTSLTVAEAKVIINNFKNKEVK